MWSGPIPSGGTDTQYESFSEPGTYEIKVYAKDIEGAESVWSDSHYITIEEPPNDPPETPLTPNGPSSGITGVEYSFSTSSTDPNGDKIKYGWDWDNNGDADEWSNLKLSGITCTKKKTWNNPGTYQIKVIAEDEHGAVSEWSQTITITISINNPPNTPNAPQGPTSGEKGTSYQYSASSTDPDGDDIEYKFNWGDGSDSVWKGPYDSGEVVTVSHKWTEEGGFNVRVKVRDEHGSESGWSEPLSVVMPKSSNKPIILKFLREILAHFPLLLELLNL